MIEPLPHHNYNSQIPKIPFLITRIDSETSMGHVVDGLAIAADVIAVNLWRADALFRRGPPWEKRAEIQIVNFYC